MKLTVNTKSLTEAIDWAIKLYGRGNAEGSSYVGLVVTPQGEAHLYHPNAVSYMKAPFLVMASDLQGEDKGVALALEGRYLKGLINALNSNRGDTELSTEGTSDKNPSLAVKTSNGSFTVPSVAVRPSQEPKLHHLGEVNDQEFLGYLQRLSKLCDAVYSGSVPALGAVDVAFDLEEKKVTMMATDRYALGEAVFDLNPLVTEAPDDFSLDHVLIPMEVATVVTPSREGMENLTLVYEKKGKKFGYLFPNGRVALFSLKDAAAIAYGGSKEKVNKVSTSILRVEKGELRKAIATVSSLSWEERHVLFTITADGVTVSDSNKATTILVEAGEGSTFTGEVEALFFTKVINEGLAPLTAAELSLRWGGDTPQAFVLDSILDDGTVDPNLFVFVATARQP